MNRSFNLSTKFYNVANSFEIGKVNDHKVVNYDVIRDLQSDIREAIYMVDSDDKSFNVVLKDSPDFDWMSELVILPAGAGFVASGVIV